MLSQNIDIDLAFHECLDEKLLKIIDSNTQKLLISPQPWIVYFTKWIKVFHHNKKLNCPSLFRQTTSFSIGLQFTDDSNIALINKRWRDKDCSTDVLSFPAIDNDFSMQPDPALELGDIIVSAETAQRQSKDQNHNLDRELTWLVCHGFLHLLGWDHLDSTSLKKMLDFQDKLLKVNTDFAINPLSCKDEL